MKKNHHLFHQRGFTLIELSMALALAGSLMVLVVIYSRSVYLESSSKDEIYLVQQVNDAIEGFAFRHNRLPCPALDEKGVGPDECVKLTGYVPFHSLGLPSGFGGIKYNVTGQSNITRTKQDRLDTVKFLNDTVNSGPVLSLAKDGFENNDNYKKYGNYYSDFCVSLKTNVDKSAAVKKIAIYSLEFERLPLNTKYLVNGVEMYNNLNCQSLLANASRSQVNVALAADFMYRAASDLHKYALTKIEYTAQELSATRTQLLARTINAFGFKPLTFVQAGLNLDSVSTSSLPLKPLQIVGQTSLIASYAAYISQLASRFWILPTLENSKSIEELNATRLVNIRDDLQKKKVEYNNNVALSIYEGIGFKVK